METLWIVVFFAVMVVIALIRRALSNAIGRAYAKFRSDARERKQSALKPVIDHNAQSEETNGQAL